MASVTAPASTSAEPRRRNYARIAELTWIWSIVGYSLLRFVVAWGAFSEHGANVWVFGIIDVGTAWPYAKSVAEVCKRAARSEWKALPLPLVVAVATFFAPYAYLWFAAGEMPGGVRVGMVICVSVLLIAAGAGVFAKTRKLRAEVRAEAASPEHATTDAPLIDLRADAASPVEQAAPVEPAEPADTLVDLTADEVVTDHRITKR